MCVCLRDGELLCGGHHDVTVSGEAEEQQLVWAAGAEHPRRWPCACGVELQTKVCEDFTINEKAPTRGVLNVKALVSKGLIRGLFHRTDLMLSAVCLPCADRMTAGVLMQTDWILQSSILQSVCK